MGGPWNLNQLMLEQFVAIDAEREPLAARGTVDTAAPDPWKTYPAATWPINYAVTDIGVDHDIKRTVANEKDASAKTGKVWDMTGKKFNEVPKETVEWKL